MSNSKPSPKLNLALNGLVSELKRHNYPIIELVDIISIQIMLDYILSDEVLTKSNSDFIERSVGLVEEILGDSVYLKIDLKLISLEDEFYRIICIDRRQYENRIFEEIKQILVSR